MKRIVISVVATLLVLMVLAQVGLLGYFGIPGLSFGQWKKNDSNEDEPDRSEEVYYDGQSQIGCCVKAGDELLSYSSRGSA